MGKPLFRIGGGDSDPLCNKLESKRTPPDGLRDSAVRGETFRIPEPVTAGAIPARSTAFYHHYERGNIMPEFTNQDRQMIEAEQTLWNVSALLDNVQGGGAWRKRIKELHESCVVVARKLQEYNDQFETED